MRVSIYVIRCVPNGKVYVGKTINPKRRFATHRWAMRRTPRHNDCNIHLWNACQKYGIDSFTFDVVDEIEVDEVGARDAELKWMDRLRACDKSHGFNLRRDSATKMHVADETRKRMSSGNMGRKNPNYGNKWSQGQKDAMSRIAKERHAAGVYGDEWREKLGRSSSEMWKDEEKRKRMAKKVSVSKRKYRFRQYTRDGDFIREWDSVEQILNEHPSYKWQNIYAVCGGYKPTYMGYVWEKVLKDDT